MVKCSPSLLAQLLSDLKTGIRSTAFYQKKVIQSGTSHNEFLYSKYLRVPLTHSTHALPPTPNAMMSKGDLLCHYCPTHVFYGSFSPTHKLFRTAEAVCQYTETSYMRL